jgi:uncharacterized protein YbjT (DUF2867 family)
MSQKGGTTMSELILVTGAAGGAQGSTGRNIAHLLLDRGIAVRAFVHKVDARSEGLRERGAEVFEGDLLDPARVREALKGVRRAYFTYPVTDGLLEATTIFAAAARDAKTELVVNNSQLQNRAGAPTFRNLQHRLADRIFDWAQVKAVHLHAPPYYENVRALVARSVAEKGMVLLPWGDGSARIPLVSAEDVARVAAAVLANEIAPERNGYDLVGAVPTVCEIVEALGDALGKPVKYVAITDEQWADAMKPYINAHALDHLSRLWRYFREGGATGFVATDAVRVVTGKDAMGLEEFFERNASVFASA